MKYPILALLIPLLFPVSSGAQETAAVMRISLENTQDHIQVKIVRAFAERLNARLKGVLEARVYDNARLFRDRDAVTGLFQGKAEMAVPGIWNIEPSVPELGVLLLPIMYGRSPHDVHKLVDGDLGKILTGRVESALGVESLGRWIDLGHAHIFTVDKEIRRYRDFRGLTIRVAGGMGNELRIRALGAEAVSIPWPDFPARLRAGAVDGVLTSYESVASARLWETGLRFAYEDSQYFAMYLPLMNKSFLRSLPEAARAAVREEWESHVEEARKLAAEAQDSARRLILANGVRINLPTHAEVENSRALMKSHITEFLRKMNIAADFYTRFENAMIRE